MRIEIERVSKRFGRVQALADVSLVIPTGRRLLLVGPNGSGKSTLIRALLGLIECEGSIRIAGVSPYENRSAVLKKVAYVPQIAPQLVASVKEVIELVALTRDIPMDAIADVARQFDIDLFALFSRRFRDLSGGMKQKLLLAIAFSARPAMLVMDEPTSSLDVRARHRFADLCRTLVPTATMILCSHRLEEQRELAEHVVVMADGRLEFEGTRMDYIDQTSHEAQAV